MRDFRLSALLEKRINKLVDKQAHAVASRFCNRRRRPWPAFAASNMRLRVRRFVLAHCGDADGESPAWEDIASQPAQDVRDALRDDAITVNLPGKTLLEGLPRNIPDKHTDCQKTTKTRTNPGQIHCYKPSPMQPRRSAPPGLWGDAARPIRQPSTKPINIIRSRASPSSSS